MVSLLYEIPASLEYEINNLESLIVAFRGNAISEPELKANRVPFGIYEQRKKGTFMVRVRCAAGIITPSQLKRVAELSLQFASGILHITTRQEIQIHDVVIENLISIIRELAKVGLSTRGGGGNTVRNITASWDSGVATDEVFDVAPYAVALTSAMINRSDSWLLPRKYKIAFSNSEKDTAFASVSDLGFIAKIKDGVPGFRVFVAGGMGRHSQPGHLLHEFVPASDIFIIAEAIKQVFSKYGNRKNKHTARLRFLWKSLGREQFIALYEKEKERLLMDGVRSPEIRAIANELTFPVSIKPETEASDDFDIWKKRYVRSQKQPGAHMIILPFIFGHLTAEKARELADFLLPFGDNTIRFTHNQNLALRNIPTEYLPNVYHVVQRITDLAKYPALLGSAVACAGASTCQLGICRSRGALEAIIDRLKVSSVNLDILNNFRLHISGCSNTCGQHMIADIGFFGKVGRKDQHSYPLYSIVAGAVIDPKSQSRLAEHIDSINAHDLPKFVENLLHHYSERKSQYSTFVAYLHSEGLEVIHRLCDRFREIPSFDIDRSYYRDWGDTEPFSLAGKGTGECSAGLFDLIELDLMRLRQLRTALLENSYEAPAARMLYDLALVSARMLLITRGVEASSDSDVFDQFTKLFIDAGLIDERFHMVIEKGCSGKAEELISLRDDVIALSNAVEKLYQSMDNSLQFKLQEWDMADHPQHVIGEEQIHADLFKDFRGVACPMNFVKTKMALAGLKTGQVLEIVLDDGDPIENVPRSLIEEGHQIIEQNRQNNYWTVKIRKGH